MTKIVEALLSLGYKDFTVTSNDYNQIDWLVVPSSVPTKAEVQAEIIRLEAEQKAEQLAKEELRQSAINKLAALGLTEDEAKTIMGVN